jgi:hypothetical protein
MCVIDLINIELINTYFIDIYSDLFKIKFLKYGIILQSKKCSFVRNYLAEQERLIAKKLSCRARNIP